MEQLSFFDLNDRLEQISKIGDPLEVLNDMVDWGKFDGILLKAKVKGIQDRNVNGNAGRKPFGLRLMLKVFILQSLYNLSDDQMEYQIKNRLSFMRFLGLGLNGTVPDAKTIWNYREMFVRTETWERLFKKFDRMLGWVKGNHELFVRTIGMARAKAKILASFLTYNMFRMVALARPKWA